MDLTDQDNFSFFQKREVESNPYSVSCRKRIRFSSIGAMRDNSNIWLLDGIFCTACSSGVQPTGILVCLGRVDFVSEMLNEISKSRDNRFQSEVCMNECTAQTSRQRAPWTEEVPTTCFPCATAFSNLQYGTQRLGRRPQESPF